MMWQKNEEPGDAHQRAAIGAWGVRFGLSMRVAYDLQVADSESVAAQSIQFVRGDVSMAGSWVSFEAYQAVGFAVNVFREIV